MRRILQISVLLSLLAMDAFARIPNQVLPADQEIPLKYDAVRLGKWTDIAVKSVLKQVADWQIANPNTGAEHDDLDWTHAALYIGMTDWAELAKKEDGDDSYYQWLLRVGQRNHFQVGKRMYHADFIAVGQPFIDLYRKYGNKKMIAPVMARANWVLENPAETTLELDYGKPETLDRWSWCDALFMAPPIYAKFYAMTGNKKYLNFLNREYKATYEFLYDKEEHLFYRDSHYFSKKETNGKKVFWGRGNGWVLGGLAEILQALPQNEPSRTFYQDLFVTLATRVAGLQNPDGYWHASLLDPASYPSPETSATGNRPPSRCIPISVFRKYISTGRN